MAVSGHIISSLESSIYKGSADDFEHSCGQCLVDGHDVEAHGFCVDCHEYLCVTCFRAHSKNKASRQHKLLGKNEISNVKIDQLSTRICTEKCAVHKEEIVKFFCSKHEVLCCNDCVVLSHRNCEVEYIPEKCSEIGESAEYQETLQELETRQKMVDKIKAAANKIEGELDSSAETVMNEILVFEQELYAHIGKLRKKVESEVETRRETNKQIVKGVFHTCGKMASNMDQHRKEMLDSKKENQLAQLYTAIKKSKNALKSENVSECIKMLRDSKTRFCFERSIDMDKLTEKTVCLGMLTDIGDKPRDAIISRRKIDSKTLYHVVLYIGSSHMTFGYSSKSRPERVFSKRWCSGEKRLEKAPTDLLINPDGQSVCAFGYEAGQKYNELVQTAEEEKYFYYHGDYILNIYRDMDENRKFACDVSGKKLPSIVVLSTLIRILKDEAISSIRETMEVDDFCDGDAHFVITVPERFKTAREALQEATNQARFVSEDLTIVFETEAAFMYTQDRDSYMKKSLEGPVELFRDGARYLLLDARDKMFTVTVYEVSSDKSTQLYHEANESCGGNSVIEEAVKFLLSFYGHDITQEFKDKYPEIYHDMVLNIEDCLRSLKSDKALTIHGSFWIHDIVKKHTDRADKDLIRKQTTRGITAQPGRLRIDPSIVKKFFQCAVSTIASHIHYILQDKAGLGCKAIVMIGGFSRSPVLHEGLKKEFSDLEVVVPDSPELAVMLGAVGLGHSLSTPSGKIH